MTLIIDNSRQSVKICRISVISGPLTNGKRKLSTPSASLVPPVSGGQSVTTANANHPLSPPETGGSTRRGRGWIKLSAHFVVTKFTTTPAPAWNTRGNKSLRSLRSLRETQKLSYLLSHAKDAKDAELQYKLRCRWSSRWLRATENAKGQSKRKREISSSSSTFLIYHSIFLLSHLTLIHPLRFARPACLRGTVSYNRKHRSSLIVKRSSFIVKHYSFIVHQSSSPILLHFLFLFYTFVC